MPNVLDQFGLIQCNALELTFSPRNSSASRLPITLIVECKDKVQKFTWRVHTDVKCTLQENWKLHKQSSDRIMHWSRRQGRLVMSSSEFELVELKFILGHCHTTKWLHT